MRFQPKNWSEFQHYRDRNPTWIKLHKRLLDDFDFQGLPLASRALAPMLWLLASEDKNGWIDYDEQKIAFRLRVSKKDLAAAIKPLISGCFFVLEQDASAPLAEVERVAIPERERQVTSKTENIYSSSFEEFWTACPKKVGRGKAEGLFFKIAAEGVEAEKLIQAMRGYAHSQAGKDPTYIAHPSTWLNQQRWLDETGAPNGVKIHILSDEIRQREQENLKRMGVI